MIKLSGSLSIRTIHGRNGDFNVGRLLTEIGEFAVKDALIEEYEEGRYEGDFGITGIYPAHYLAGGRLVVEIRAKLETISLSGIDDLAPEDATPAVEPDPIEEELKTSPTPSASPDAQALVEQNAQAESTSTEPESSDPEAELKQLFVELYPLEAKVKLDPTVGRALFRQQKDTLKQMGYRFVPIGQYWERTASQT
jgi:hypothetical protein